MVTHHSLDTGAGVGGSESSGGDGAINIGTALVVDADRNVVRGVVFDTVEGYGRFIASAQVPSTVGPPIDDLGVALREVVGLLEAQTGLKLAAADEHEPDLSSYVLTGLPAAALRAVIVPTGEHQLTLMLASIARGTSAIVDVLDATIRTEDGALSATLLENQLRGLEPDIAVLIEGRRAQAEWASAIGTFGALLSDRVVGQLIVLGSEEFQQHAIQVIGEDADLTGLDPASYEPKEVADALESELVSLYDDRAAQASSVGLLRSPVFVSRARACDLATRYIARRREKNVASVTISDGTAAGWSTARTGAAVSRPEIDLHGNVRAALGQQFELARTLLPVEMSREDLGNWILNRAIRPRVSAVTPRDQVIESVLASALVREVWNDFSDIAGNQIDIAIGGPAFCTEISPALGVLSLLNGLRPAPLSGVVEVYLDPDGLLVTSGAVGQVAPAIAADAIEQDLLSPTATVIVVEGGGSDDEPAVTGRLTHEDGDSVAFSVPFGSFHRIALGAGERGSLVLTCEPGFAIGGSSPGEELEFGRTSPLRGGEAGILIDARGSGIDAADASIAPSRDQVRRWYGYLGIVW